MMSQTGFKRVGGLVVGKAGADPVRGPGHYRHLDQQWVDSVIRALSRPRQCESSASSAACEGQYSVRERVRVVSARASAQPQRKGGRQKHVVDTYRGREKRRRIYSTKEQCTCALD